jgi:hypothetical protein
MQKTGTITVNGDIIGTVEEEIVVDGVLIEVKLPDAADTYFFGDYDADGYNPSGRAEGSDTGKGFHHHGIGHSRPSHERHQRREPHKNQHHFPGHAHHPAPGRHHHPGHDRKPDAGLGDIPYSSTGNPFDRSRLKQELEEKPWLREKIKRISLGENQDPRANTAVQETMFNRAIVRGTSLEAQAKRHRSSGVDERGYYAGYAAHYSAEKGQMADRNLDQVLKGSNITGYATDNSSGNLAARERASGSFKHHQTINGESFFSPGSAQPALRDRWQNLNKRATEFETNKKAVKAIDPSTEPM